MPTSEEAIRRSQEVQQRVEAIVKDAFYDARNAGRTMDQAAHKASTDVMLYLIDESILENPRLMGRHQGNGALLMATGPLVVNEYVQDETGRVGRVIKTTMYREGGRTVDIQWSTRVEPVFDGPVERDRTEAGLARWEPNHA